MFTSPTVVCLYLLLEKANRITRTERRATGHGGAHERITLLHRAPHQGPARCLEFSRYVAVAPLDVASLGRWWPLGPAPFASSSIEDHVPALVGIYVLEIEVLFWRGTRHDEYKVCHLAFTSDRFESLAHSRMEARANAGSSWRRPGPRCLARESERSEDSTTGETEGRYDELRESGRHTVALTQAFLGDLMGIHS